jgi:type I restriction enzyme, S subunit
MTAAIRSADIPVRKQLAAVETAPDKWLEMPFGEFATLQRGKDLTKSQFRDGTVPVGGSNGIIGYHDTAIASGPGITVGRSGSAGKVTYFEQDFWPHNTALYVKDFHGNDPLFTRYFFGYLDLSRFKTGASVPTLDRNSFKMLPVIVPPLREQKKIAHILSTVQRAIEEQERIVQTTTELKKALMHKLFTEGLRNDPQKQTEIGPIPKSWELEPLGALAKVGNGSTPKRDNQAFWQGGTIPWLNSARIHDRFITEPDQFVTDLAVKQCHLPRVKPDSLLIAITGQGKTLGNSAITRFETCINQHLAYAQFTSEKIVPDFVLWFMQTHYDFLRGIAQAGGSTKGALTCGYLKTHLIPIPSIGEQQEIVSVFNALDQKEKTATRKRDQSQDLFRTLLHDLMTAQSRISSLDLPEV